MVRDMSLTAERRINDLFINQRCAECHGIKTMSNDRLSPALGEMWHHGYLVSPHWEGGLELDSASDCDNANAEVGTSAAQDHATESGPKDYMSVVRESSQRILIRDSPGPPEILVLRTAGSKWNSAKLNGEFAALWFSLDTRWE